MDVGPQHNCPFDPKMGERVATAEAHIVDLKSHIVDLKLVNIEQTRKMDELVQLFRRAEGGWKVILGICIFIGGLFGTLAAHFLPPR